MNEQDRAEGRIRPSGQADTHDMLAIINAASEAYRGVIPPDRWHDPYMPADELAAELADGVAFSGYEADGRLVGVMGVQRRRNVDLVRHAYVLPRWQGHGIGARLLRHLCHDAKRPILIGTWAAADWGDPLLRTSRLRARLRRRYRAPTAHLLERARPADRNVGSLGNAAACRQCGAPAYCQCPSGIALKSAFPMNHR